MLRLRYLLGLIVVAAVLLCVPGCVGPNKLKRGLDEHLNQSYVKRPLVSELLFPINLIANHLAVAGDLLIFNPTYWWRDVLRGQGTPYYYTNPEVPEETPADVEEKEEVGSD